MTRDKQAFTLDNDFQIEQLMTDFRFCFLAKLNAALESGAISEQDLEERPMTVARCVLVLTGEDMVPRSARGKAMLENLRHFV
jgi:hypothetical protein